MVVCPQYMGPIIKWVELGIVHLPLFLVAHWRVLCFSSLTSGLCILEVLYLFRGQSECAMHLTYTVHSWSP